MKSLIIICIFIHSISFCQKRTYGLEFYANPYVQKYGNLDKQYIITTIPDFDVHYAKTPSQNFGINFTTTHKSKNRSFYFGLLHVTNHYNMRFLLYAPTFYKQIVLAYQEISLTTQNLGFKFGFSHQLNPRIQISYGFNFFAPYYPKYHDVQKYYSATTYASGIPANFYYFILKYSISVNGNYPQLFIPEIQLKLNLHSNLKLNLGTQLKCYDIDKESGVMDVTATGLINTTYTGQTSELLHFSRIKETQMNFFLGLSYQLDFKRKQTVSYE